MSGVSRRQINCTGYYRGDRLKFMRLVSFAGVAAFRSFGTDGLPPQFGQVTTSLFKS
jgi:hypothetical protein